MKIDIRISGDHARSLFEHLFSPQGGEHGAVLGASVIPTKAGTTLLIRRVFLAKDDIDYVVGPSGFHQLTARFVRDKAFECAEAGLSYLPVHNHGGIDAVEFSPVDIASHERGYPAIVQICRNPVVGLVFARNAVAGDVWFTDGSRGVLDRMTIIGKTLRTLRQSPIAPQAAGGKETHQRQALMLGIDGQRILASLKVGIVGLGGVGSLISEYLARLGVGHIVAVDPERIEESNHSRIVGSRRSDYAPPFWRRATAKVKIAQRVAKEAHPRIRFESIFDDFRKPEIVTRFTDCDFVFLAADSMSVRLLFNQMVHQFLIPGLAVGSKASVRREDGSLRQAFSVVRAVGPNGGCLWCNGLILAHGLTEEATTSEIRAAGRYVDDPEVVAPSVITLNAVGAAHAVNEFLFYVTALLKDSDTDFRRYEALTGETYETRARTDVLCPQCVSRLGAGKALPMATVL